MPRPPRRANNGCAINEVKALLGSGLCPTEPVCYDSWVLTFWKSLAAASAKALSLTSLGSESPLKPRSSQNLTQSPASILSRPPGGGSRRYRRLDAPRDRFAVDSPLEEAGFELFVSLRISASPSWWSRARKPHGAPEPSFSVAGPIVRIHLSPAESPRTIGSAGDFTGSMSGVAGPARVYRRERWAAYIGGDPACSGSWSISSG